MSALAADYLDRVGPLEPHAQPVLRRSVRSDDGTSPVFQKFNKMLHGGAAAQMRDDEGNDVDGGRPELLNLEFIRKYIKFAKVNIVIVLPPPKEW